MIDNRFGAFQASQFFAVPIAVGVAMETVTYHYRTAEISGSVELGRDSVVTHIRRRGSRWHQETPYGKIMPFPTRVTSTSPVFWPCLLVGFAGLCGGLWGIADNAGTNMTMPWAAMLAVGGLTLIIFAVWNRSIEWLMYPTELQGHCIQFCRNGPDAASFESFAETLMERVNAARNSD